MLLLLAGIGTAWLCAMVINLIMGMFAARADRIEAQIWQLIKEQSKVRTQQMEEQSKQIIDTWKRTGDPALEVMKMFDEMTESAIKREGFTVHWPENLPPEVLSSILRCVSSKIDSALSDSDALHKELGG